MPQIKTLYELCFDSKLSLDEIAIDAGFTRDQFYAWFANRRGIRLFGAEAAFNALGYTLLPIPKDRLNDVLEYLSRPTTSTGPMP